MKTLTPQKPTEEPKLLRNNLEKSPGNKLKRTKLKSQAVNLKPLFSIIPLPREEMTLTSIRIQNLEMEAEDMTQNPLLQEPSKLLLLQSSVKTNILSSSKRPSRNLNNNIQDGNHGKFPKSSDSSGKRRKTLGKSPSQDNPETENSTPSYYQATDNSRRIRNLNPNKLEESGDSSPLKPNNTGLEKLRTSRTESHSEPTC